MTANTIISFILFLAFTAISCNDKSDEISSDKPNLNNIFASLDYDKVVAYNYDGEGGVEIINSEGKLAPKIKKQNKLAKAEIIKITNIFCSTSSYGGDVASCFDPHFGVVFYKVNKPITYVSVCLDCNFLISSIKIPSSIGTGFSDKGAKNIFDFEKQIKILQ